ncbi:bifunctional hydroxymethylpyrimidine kinase/phosphomethylpyrimidine kinase [Halalkalicoccus sp. NIPERK01]|uniref:bifunctional hydroxymethylpyrimidine kinase/phosphomethylpyrimidine kinase n=1 Tax=Halalkalicoccus sp. NIPERK01 TaxID=3053469 RepID=UPI00256F4729|nr:bifunctional hydroxymethylpyrimidine kinase/phosphomethylpyrimidine kinase [Halalkalicoccus sp. NIPERK01]MDL5361978.1 bifunctional hydroxymethylpyrimidine kinase/phosphomethylpyrimidine kinase [Halalkalicoccus sp. NIPERK01]
MTRRASPHTPSVALTIAGSDSGGGAGIQADLKTMESHGVFATSAVTAITAQNTQGVERSHVLPVEEIGAQIETVREDFDVGAVKTGMLATSEVVELVVEKLADYDGPTVIDPVMVATSGDRLLEPDAEAAYEDLIGEATLVTPNADEAAVLTGIDPEDADDAREAGEQLVGMGAEAALVKGGHLSTDDVKDVLVTEKGYEVFEHARVDTDATHGSGCTLGSAIAARLARGEEVEAAVEDALDFMERAVRYPLDVGQGPGAVHHLVGLRNRAEREPTAERVDGIVERFVAEDLRGLVPEVGMNVVGATPYAERVDETAAVEGRITRTLSGIAPNRGVRFGASSHVARFLLSAREFAPDLRYAVNCRFDDDVEAALDALEAPITEFDRDEEPEELKQEEGSTMGWGARQAFDIEETPAAVIDRGEVGKEAIVKLVAPDPETLIERALAVHDALD